VTEADPIEVFRPPNRWTLLGGNLLRSGLILIGFFVVLYSSRPGPRVTCNCPPDHLSAWLWLLPAAAVGLVALTIEVWCVTQVQIYPIISPADCCSAPTAIRGGTSPTSTWAIRGTTVDPLRDGLVGQFRP
jgi:hypothetical protein